MTEDISLFEKELKKRFGNDIISLGVDVVKNDKKVIPISPALDTILGGGVPEGSIISLAGQTGCGKTTIALTLAANAQKVEHGSRKIYILDAEGRMEKKNLSGITGLDVEKVKIIRSTKDKQLSAEEYMEIAIDLVKNEEKSVIIIDSIAALCPSSEITEDVSGQIRSTTGRVMASFCRKVAGPISCMNNIVVVINHLICNQTQYGEHLLVDGGEKLKFAANVRMVCKKKPQSWVKDSVIIGQISEWHCLKSAIGPPDGVTSSYIRYGKGIDSIVEVVNMAIELGIIIKGGSWYKLPFVSDTCQFQGQEKVNDYISGNPKLIDEIKTKILETM